MHWDINVVHVHISLHCLVHGIVFKLAFREVNLVMRRIASGDCLCLL